MPRFHFHLADGRDYPDEEGIVLPSITDARRLALMYMSEVLRDAASQPLPEQDWLLEVTTEEGLTLFTLNMFGIDAPVTGGH